MATLNNIEKILQAKLQKAVNKLPTILVNEAVNWTKENFSRQGFPGQSFNSWPPRASNAIRNKGRALLVNTGRLKRSIRIISTGPLQAKFGTDVPYAAAHNNGFKGTVNVKAHQRNKIGNIRVSTGKTGQPFKNKKTITGVSNIKAHQRHMNLPRRRFIGYSPVLQSILRRKAIIHIGRELKS
jgi:phage gpG-like protein